MRIRRFHTCSLACSTIAVVAATLTTAPAAIASGFAVPELSIAGLGLSNALVANPDERGALAYNPAAMAFHEDSSWAVGGVFLNPAFSVRTTAGRTDSDGADWVGAPLLQAAIRVDDRWSVGLGMNAPFGLETRWPTGTFPPLTGVAPPPNPPVPLSPQPTASQLKILDVTPTATYRISDNLALSAGADIYLATSAELDSSLSRLDGDGTGWGFNLSALYVREALSLGVNFHSAASVRLEGFYTPTNALLVRAGRLNPSQSAELDLDLPWRLQLGARYELMPSLAVELDWTRTGWSEFDEIKVKSRASGRLLLPPDQNQWDDASAYRLGVTYDLVERTQLRLGYSYDETGQGDDYFSARVPDNNRHLFSLGIRQTLNDGWQIEAGYMYAKTIERNVRGERPYDPSSPGEINGTDAIAGRYQADVHLIGLEINKGFTAF